MSLPDTHRPQRARIAFALLFVLLPLLSLLGGTLASASAPAQAPTAAYSVYLPSIAKSAGSSPAPSPTPSPTPTVPPSNSSGGVFLTRDPRTASPAVAVDSAGGIHVAYAGYVGYGTLSPGYYAYCGAASDCSKDSSWQIVSFGQGSDYIVKVELALTKAGKPRLLLYNDENGRSYTYAACDSSCTSAASWKTADVAKVQWDTDLNTFDYSYHAFALDPQDRPRFIYQDHYGSIHNGVFYAACDSACTSAASWGELNISAGPAYDGDIVQTPDLAFTKAGQPRILTQLYSNAENYPEGVYYISCDSGCDQASGWQRTRIFDRGNGHAAWTLALDSSDRPRAALYQAELSDGGNQLAYAWCNSSCASAASWSKDSVGLAQFDGQDPVLALDSQNRPRIAYTKPSLEGIGYAWCNSQCESAGGAWQSALVEPMDTLNQDYDVPLPIECSLGTWAGVLPMLALDPAGNPRVGYEGQHLHGGTCSAGIDQRSVRFAFFKQP